MTDDAAVPPGSADTADKPYTAVIFCHGMGQQRHYESMWRIIESLDAWVFARGNGSKEFIDKRLLLKARRERLRQQDGSIASEEIVHIEVRHAGEARARRARFFEGYWAPATVAGTSAISVVTWLLAQLVRPLEVLFAPWRSFGRLRRADLNALIGRQDDTVQQDCARTVLRRYSEFVLRRPPESGSFASFLRYLEKFAPPSRRDDVLAFARRWRRSHYYRLMRTALLLMLLGLSLASVALLVVLGCLALVRQGSEWAWLKALLSPSTLEVDVGTVLSLAAAVALATGVTRFLRDAVGDVQQFVNYQESEALHERRKKIMETTCRTLRHVLADPQCERAVVFAHSLGSAVALDAILALRGLNESAAPTQSAESHMNGPIPLRKIEHLVTCGSPIDKIAFFFATVGSNVRAFERMVDALRGDIGNVPFSKAGRQPHVHWVNFWDRGDPISGPVETMAPAELRRQRVDNVRLASLPWPDIAASHDAYFDDPDVIEYLYRIIFLGEASFASPRMTTTEDGSAGQRPLYEWLGPGRGNRLQSALSLLMPALMIMLVWTVVGILLPGVPSPSIEWLGAFAAVLIGVGLLQRAIRPRLLLRRSQHSRRDSQSSS